MLADQSIVLLTIRFWVIIRLIPGCIGRIYIFQVVLAPGLSSRVIHQFTDSLIHSLAHLLTRSFVYSFTHSLTQPLVHFFSHSLNNSFTHPFTHSPIHPLTLLLTYSLIHLAIDSLTRQFTRAITR